jgi:hypothetical protein
MNAMAPRLVRTVIVVDMGYKTPCHIMQGKPHRDGYMRFRGQLAHRWNWEQKKGPIPYNTTLDHLCRVRRCIRISHLKLATHADNSFRTAGKLTMREARRIRKLYAAGGISYAMLGKQFGVSYNSVMCIVKGYSYREK